MELVALLPGFVDLAGHEPGPAVGLRQIPLGAHDPPRPHEHEVLHLVHVVLGVDLPDPLLK